MSDFDLEGAIAAWRRRFTHRRAILADDLDELERHLRDHLADLVASGMQTEAAFHEASARLGEVWDAEGEFRKVYWEKVHHRRLAVNELIWRTGMLKNYLKISLRQLKRKPMYAAINVVGLAVGMTCCLLIGLYVQDERSYDRFHQKKDRLVMFGNENKFWGRNVTTPYPLGPALRADVPEVELTARTFSDPTPIVTREETGQHGKHRLLLADSSFFQLFSFEMLRGDPKKVLDTPDAAVITEGMATAYFGDEDPIGKSLHFVRSGDDAHDVTVRGVVADVPAHSTIRFDMVVPITVLPARFRREDGWGSFMYKTYGLLAPNADVDAFSRHLPAALSHHFDGKEQPYFAVPLTSLYLSDLYAAGGFRGQMRYLYIFGSIALFVLLIAAINYVNLVTAQASQRAREVGVRKTLGAGRGQLIRQFLGESVLTTVAALAVALLLTALALPAFNALFQKDVAFSLRTYGFALPALSLFVLLVGVGAGTYPAFVLSRARPIQALCGGCATTRRGRSRLRQGLVVTQFAISIFLIVGTAIIYEQLDYAHHKKLGFSGEQVVQIDLPYGDRYWDLRNGLKQRVAAHPGVLSATTADAVPGSFDIHLVQTPEEWSPEAGTHLPKDENLTIAPAKVDYDYVETLGLHLVAGRDFSREQASDLDLAYILNETAARGLGWTPAEAIGKPFRSDEATPEGRVIGVVQDFHVASLRSEIDPVVLQLHDADWRGTVHLLARLAPAAIAETMPYLEEEMKRIAPEEPFSYQFLDDVFDQMYRAERRLSEILSSFAVLALFIACLGLFGLASFAAETRTKEVGIRKVMGASVGGIVALLSRDTVRLTAIAFVLATPLAYLAMHRWLDDFAYRIDITWPTFVFAGLLTLAIGLLTVSSQAIRAARSNPVESLRYE